LILAHLVRGEQVVKRLNELGLSHPSVSADEPLRTRAVRNALRHAALTTKSGYNARVLGSTDTVVLVSHWVYSLGSKRP
jgi:hypothetical protein